MYIIVPLNILNIIYIYIHFDKQRKVKTIKIKKPLLR